MSTNASHHASKLSSTQRLLDARGETVKEGRARGVGGGAFARALAALLRACPPGSRSASAASSSSGGGSTQCHHHPAVPSPNPLTICPAPPSQQEDQEGPQPPPHAPPGSDRRLPPPLTAAERVARFVDSLRHLDPASLLPGSPPLAIPGRGDGSDGGGGGGECCSSCDGGDGGQACGGSVVSVSPSDSASCRGAKDALGGGGATAAAAAAAARLRAPLSAAGFGWPRHYKHPLRPAAAHAPPPPPAQLRIPRSGAGAAVSAKTGAGGGGGGSHGVFVGGLPPGATEAVLVALFGACGAIRRLWIARDPRGASLRYGYIIFADAAAARAALALDGAPLLGPGGAPGGGGAAGGGGGGGGCGYGGCGAARVAVRPSERVF